MTRITQSIGQSPFHPIQSFTALACGDERVELRSPAMTDLQDAIDRAGKLRDVLVMGKGAITAGADPEPILADADARLSALNNSMGHFSDRIEAKEGQKTDCGGDVARGTGCGSCSFCEAQTRLLDACRPNWRDGVAQAAVEDASTVREAAE